MIRRLFANLAGSGDGKKPAAPDQPVICVRIEMLDYNLFKPIRNFGLFILATGVAGFFCLVVFFDDPDFSTGAKIFIIIVSAFNLFMSYNIVSRNRYGYRCLKIYLCIIYPGFPLGYFYAKKTFEYIESYGIQRFYSKSLKI